MAGHTHFKPKPHKKLTLTLLLETELLLPLLPYSHHHCFCLLNSVQFMSPLVGTAKKFVHMLCTCTVTLHLPPIFKMLQMPMTSLIITSLVIIIIISSLFFLQDQGFIHV